MIRVTSGIAKGRRLELPKNKKITAVKEVVKLAMFSIMGDKIPGSVCLDLYSGSGNLGIEALSRGAAFCTFIDESGYSIETIEKNLRNTRLADQGEVMRDDVLKFLANIESKYDIIFADPYYAETSLRHLIKLGVERLNPQGIFFLLVSSENNLFELPKELEGEINVETRKYGKTLLIILTRNRSE